MPEQTPRPPRSSFVPPRSTTDAQPPTGSDPRQGRGFMSYFTAGANASAGRDSNIGPLDG